MSGVRLADSMAVCSLPIVGDRGTGYHEAVRCKRCGGKGYHHGFGEHGQDPDWCLCCGGSGIDWHELLTPPET